VGKYLQTWASSSVSMTTSRALPKHVYLPSLHPILDFVHLLHVRFFIGDSQIHICFPSRNTDIARSVPYNGFWYRTKGPGLGYYPRTIWIRFILLQRVGTFHAWRQLSPKVDSIFFRAGFQSISKKSDCRRAVYSWLTTQVFCFNQVTPSHGAL